MHFSSTHSRSADLPDSVPALARVKRDSLLSNLQAAQTVGGQRFLEHQVATLEFTTLERHDDALERLHRLRGEILELANPNPEVGAVDSTIVNEYPVFLFNRAALYREGERNREAFYCFLGVAQQYGQNDDLRFKAMLQAAFLLRETNRRGAFKLVTDAIGLGNRALAASPEDFDLAQLIQAFDMQRELAKLLRRTDIAIQAKQHMQTLRAMMEQREEAEAPTVEGVGS